MFPTKSTGHFSLRQTSSRKGRSSGRRSKALLSCSLVMEATDGVPLTTLQTGSQSSIHLLLHLSVASLNSIQRGDAEMEQKMNRALRACLERREGNPICSLHDQGAGGNGTLTLTLTPTLTNPMSRMSALTHRFEKKKGDPTLSVLELWGAEYQESNALLLRPEDRPFLEDVCRREKCPVDFVGNITGDGKLDWVLGKMPQKEFVMERVAPTLRPLVLPPGLTVPGALDRVLRLPCVASKRYLTNKGAATAIGEQPIKGLVSPGAGARMADVKCSGNWMWAAKLPGEGSALWDACQAMCEVMGQLGVAVDGGKDSLSMAARVGQDTVKAPALAQCYGQLGDSSPDLHQPQLLSACFNATQTLIKDRVLSAGHDVSDGGLITCVLEMAFAGNRGLDVDLVSHGVGALQLLFSEELGLVLEVPEDRLQLVCRRYSDAGLLCHRIGRTAGFGPEAKVIVRVDGQEVLNDKLPVLRALWEETSFQLDRLQTNELCARQEKAGLSKRTQPFFKLNFDPSERPSIGHLCKIGHHSSWAIQFPTLYNLLALLGWVAEGPGAAGPKVMLSHNVSGRFESRFVSVGILASPSVWFHGMEGSALGVWVAHGEGLMHFSSPEAQSQVISDGLAPLRYLDDQGVPTEEYPLNPNGSPGGVAGLCSRDGRHLAVMPHPERCTLGWQWPWAPRGLRDSLSPSPWLRMFTNAAAWCSSN
ncbi:hypothetical protein CRUP_014756 [Coryphaenoides rupestris]|nr:hypothetical protein CRUP_014756 [Coryphaenoides rupestris]